MKKSLVTAGLAGALLVGSAVPGFAAPAASVETDHCLEPPYTAQLVIYCGCIAVAGGLSPVIPPSSWDCNPPG